MGLSGTEIHVAAAVLSNAAGAVLLAKRPDHVHQGGLWEFPGGKLEPGETVGEALRRELAEELGIQVTDHRPLIRLRHAYVERTVILDVHRIAGFTGQPHGREGQPLVWAPPSELESYPMPAADRPVINALRLPDSYLITPPCPGDAEVLLAGVVRALSRGIRLIQLRLRQADIPLKPVATRIAELAQQAGAILMINGDADLARELGSGVHLRSDQLIALSGRPLPAGSWVAASCHSPAELEKAVALGVDFAVLSPVQGTTSHPEASPIGWARFARWVEDLPLPVYGLGGVAAKDRAVAWSHGAQGIAGIRGLWPLQ